MAPAGLTFWVLVKVIGFFDEFVAPLGWNKIPGMGLLVALAVLFFVGLLGKTFAGKVLKNFFDWVLEQLPVVRGIYRLFNQISDAFFSGNSKSSFKNGNALLQSLISVISPGIKYIFSFSILLFSFCLLTIIFIKFYIKLA